MGWELSCSINLSVRSGDGLYGCLVLAEDDNASHGPFGPGVIESWA